MSQKVPCCTKCSNIGFCTPGASCCIQCHFAYEEKKAFPYLPPQGRAWLRAQHKELKRLGYPKHLVEKHANDEMHLFRRHCPQEIVDLIAKDHEEYEQGRLRDRER